jgi:hypothetical protein
MRLNLRASLTTDDDPAKLKRISCPVLILAGDRDFLSSSASLEAIGGLLPRARTQLLGFAGHVPYFEATSAFESAARDFITSGAVMSGFFGQTPLGGIRTAASLYAEWRAVSIGDLMDVRQVVMRPMPTRRQPMTLAGAVCSYQEYALIARVGSAMALAVPLLADPA